MQRPAGEILMLKGIIVNSVSTLLLTLAFLTSVLGQTDKPTAYAVLVDNTRSMEKQFPQVVILSKAVVERIHKRGSVSLFSFISKRDGDSFVMPYSYEVHEGGNYDRAVGALGVDWNQDKNILNHYIDGLSVVRGQTDLLGAIRSMAKLLNETSLGVRTSFAAKVMILITDGDHRMEMYGTLQPTATDDERRRREKQLIKALKESGITVYSIGLTGQLSVTPREKAESFLNYITKETGGRVVFPKLKKVDVDTLLRELLGK